MIRLPAKMPATFRQPVCFVSSPRFAPPIRPHRRGRRRPSCSISPPPNSPPSRIALLVQYRGTHFHGWGYQSPSLRTVSGALLSAADDVVGSDDACELSGASRTDAGAHARGQVALLTAPAVFAEGSAWARAINARLDDDVRVSFSASAADAFDPRRSALSRRYVYSVRTSASPDVFADPFVWRVYGKQLDVESMHSAARSLVSNTTRDMRAFRKAGSPAAHTLIRVMDATVRRSERDESIIEIDVTADWFVYGMMRLLAVALVKVGMGEISPEAFRKIVEEGDRATVKTSAPAAGLCLMRVGYASDVDPFVGLTS